MNRRGRALLRRLPALGVLLLVGACGRWGYEIEALCAGPGCDGAPPPGSPDAATPLDDGGPPPTGPGCGSLQLLHETFDGAKTEDYWYALYQGGGQAVMANDRVELKLGAGSGPAEATFTANSSYDLRRSEVAVEVVRVGGQSTGIEVRDGAGRDRFGNLIGASRGVAFAIESGQLVARSLDGTSGATLATGAYDPQKARHLRVREQDGELHFETSADGSTWTSFHVQAAAMDLARVYPVLFARGQTAAASEAWLDNLNVPAAQVPGRCPAASLSDDFGAGTFTPAWRPWNGAGTCTVRASGGAAEMAFPGDFSACSLVSVSLLDLRGGAFSLRLGAVPTDASFQTILELRPADGGNRVELDLHAGTAELRVYAGGTASSHGARAFDAAAEPFVRLRESGGQVTWESSADGQSWTIRDMVTPVDVSAVGLAITGVHQGTGPASAQLLRLDAVNPP